MHVRARDIDRGLIGSPNQLRVVGAHLLVALIDHEYQHDQWIAEERRNLLGRQLPPRPVSARLVEIGGYSVIRG